MNKLLANWLNWRFWWCGEVFFFLARSRIRMGIKRDKNWTLFNWQKAKLEEFHYRHFLHIWWWLRGNMAIDPNQYHPQRAKKKHNTIQINFAAKKKLTFVLKFDAHEFQKLEWKIYGSRKSAMKREKNVSRNHWFRSWWKWMVYPQIINIQNLTFISYTEQLICFHCRRKKKEKSSGAIKRKTWWWI